VRRVALVAALVDPGVRQIAAAPSRDQDLEAQPGLVVEDDDVRSVRAERQAAAVCTDDAPCRQRRQQAGGARTHHQDVAAAIRAQRG
jgi:hypothetical protein